VDTGSLHVVTGAFGFTGHFIGAGPTFNPGLLTTPAAPAHSAVRQIEPRF